MKNSENMCVVYKLGTGKISLKIKVILRFFVKITPRDMQLVEVPLGFN